LSGSIAQPLRYAQVSEAARHLLATEGESGRFEFKQAASAVGPDVLVAAANWAFMNGEEYVTLLVGVTETEDQTTGLVTGEVTGVSSLSKSIHAIQSRCLETLPVPVTVTFIEEGVETPKPFLRLEIRPTAPPHFDTKGRRVTRNNASTRPLTDQELLDMYLDREADKFEQRFQRTASDVLDRLSQLAAGVEELSDDLGSASSAAWEAADEARRSESVAQMIEYRLSNLQDFIEKQADGTPRSLLFRLGDMRLAVWQAFAQDAAAKPTKTTDQLIDRLSAQLQLQIDGNDWVANLAEFQFWEEALDRRGEHGTMTSWRREIRERERFKFTTVWPLHDEIAELRKTVTTAQRRRKTRK
jgi:hypothetical protein